MLIHPSILYQALGIISAKKNVELLREFYKKILPARFYAVVTVFWDMFDFFLYKSVENFSWTILEGITARRNGWNNSWKNFWRVPCIISWRSVWRTSFTRTLKNCWKISTKVYGGVIGIHNHWGNPKRYSCANSWKKNLKKSLKDSLESFRGILFQRKNLWINFRKKYRKHARKNRGGKISG